MIICKKCNKNFPFQIKINEKIRNLGGRKYCLECSPFNQKNTRQLHLNSPVMVGRKYCPRCKQEKDNTQFYLRRHGRDFSTYCKSCSLKETIERIKKFKKLCVEYKGGQCKVCGYNKYFGALEFHHRNPKEKDFSISSSKVTVFSEKIKKELDKCDVLCSNCHREEHNRLNESVAQLD